jgi:hypothetical protein
MGPVFGLVETGERWTFMRENGKGLNEDEDEDEQG